MLKSSKVKTNSHSISQNIFSLKTNKNFLISQQLLVMKTTLVHTNFIKILEGDFARGFSVVIFKNLQHVSFFHIKAQGPHCHLLDEKEKQIIKHFLQKNQSLISKKVLHLKRWQYNTKAQWFCIFITKIKWYYTEIK